MASQFDDLSKVRHVRRGDPVAEKPTAQPTRALELRLNQLEQLVTSLTQTGEFGRLVIRNVPIKTGDEAVGVDHIVFFNANTGLYEKALAGVTFATGAYNSNPSSLVLGVCIAVNGSHGDIMIAGYDQWRDSSHKEGMVESTENYVPGVPYYLSDDEAGHVTRFPPALRIQVFMGTADHYILQPVYANPDSIEVLHRVPMGMRPMGGVRYIPPNYEQQVVVGFDALELIDLTPGANVWQLTDRSSVSAIANFGYMVADAQITTPLEWPVYVRISVNTSGAIDVISALTLADLYSGGSFFNHVTTLTPLTAGTEGTVRTYALLASGSDVNGVGALRFKFVSDDVSVRRDIIFKVPDSFMGWKMINAPVTPIATATVTGGAVTAIQMQERSVGYTTPPKVIITGTGTITTPATGVAVLDQFGSVVSVSITNPGAGYISASVAFDVNVEDIEVANGGDGEAEISVTVVAGEITAVTIVDGGTGYDAVPSLQVTDTTGTGGILQAEVTAGVITKVIIVSQGSGYTAPHVIVRPAGVFGYIKTWPGLFTAVLDGLGSITSVSISPDPAAGGLVGGWGYPIAPSVTLSGGSPTTPAVLTATVDPVTQAVTGFVIVDAGLGYSSPPTITVEESTPKLVLVGGDPTVKAEGSLSGTLLRMQSVRVVATGYGYAANTTIACSGGMLAGGTAAVVQPEIEPSTGRIIAVKVINEGRRYFAPPTLVITDPGGNGNGFQAIVQMDAWPDVVGMPVHGSGYRSTPLAGVGVPLQRIDVETGGLGYLTAPAVTVEPPTLPIAEGGRTATAVARLGGSIRRVWIESAGSGYVNPVVTVSGGGGTGAVIVAAVDATGAISSVDVLNPGYGFTSLPTLNVTGAPGISASLGVEIEATDGRVVRIELTDQGHGYTYAPQITIDPAPPGGVMAIGKAHLLGEGSVLVPVINGDGGLHLTQTSVLTEGNRLQITDYNDDLNDTPTSAYGRPNSAVFYYNIKADVELLGRWPAIPVSKALFTLNGVEQTATEFNETNGVVSNPLADVLFTKKTPMWMTYDADGCPWDREYKPYVLDRGEPGNDAIIPESGPAGDPDAWWRLWEHVFKYEVNRNTGFMHVNRASRFYQSGRLAAIGVLAPLKLIDVVTGTEARNDGTLMTGQLLMVLDNQTNIMGGTGAQIDAAVTNNIVPIYQNNTGRPVFISSIILRVSYQLSGLTTPSVNDAALITIGTQDGNYRNIIGTIDPTQVTQQGVSTKLYAPNTAKELFPDDRESSPLIMPNQTVYARVDYPVNTAKISTQVLVATIKGHVF